MSKTTYKLFGFIPLWTVCRNITDDEYYKAITERFKKELDASVLRNRG